MFSLYNESVVMILDRWGETFFVVELILSTKVRNWFSNISMSKTRLGPGKLMAWLVLGFKLDSHGELWFSDLSLNFSELSVTMFMLCIVTVSLYKWPRPSNWVHHVRRWLKISFSLPLHEVCAKTNRYSHWYVWAIALAYARNFVLDLHCSRVFCTSLWRKDDQPPYLAASVSNHRSSSLYLCESVLQPIRNTLVITERVKSLDV